MKSERDDAEESHAIVLPDAPIVMPVGELPIVREGTVGGIPAYEADPPVERVYKYKVPLTQEAQPEEKLLTWPPSKRKPKAKGRKR